MAGGFAGCCVGRLPSSLALGMRGCFGGLVGWLAGWLVSSPFGLFDNTTSLIVSVQAQRSSVVV